MRGSVDKLWQVLILFTSKYTQFCNDLAGYYIHHKADIDDEQYQSDNDEDYIRFIQEYRSTFKELTSRSFWPTPLPPDLKTIPCCYIHGLAHFLESNSIDS